MHLENTVKSSITIDIINYLIKKKNIKNIYFIIGSDNLIDPNAIEPAITSRTVGIMPTQLNGRTCKMDKIQAIAEKNNLFLIEDAAQALGSK